MGLDRRPRGRVVAEEEYCWRLADGRAVFKAAEGRRWHWGGRGSSAAASESSVPCSPAVAAAAPPVVAAAARAGWVAAELPTMLGLPEPTVHGLCEWLPLSAATRALAACRQLAAALMPRVPLALPPPQADAFLEFCLLEVLVAFDDDRLPLPISAVWGEMRAAARRAASSPAARGHLEALVFRALGPACRAQQERFLNERCPHHIAWSPDVGSSGFRTVERMFKHFAEARLIEVFHQRWHKRIHHSPNTRTCTEWLMTRVNRNHSAFVEHEQWARKAAPASV